MAAFTTRGRTDRRSSFAAGIPILAAVGAPSSLAVETAQRSLQLAETQSNTALADAIRSQMKLYQAGVPFHLH